MKKTQHYKLLGGKDGLHTCHGGGIIYKRGVWTKPVTNVEPCARGYHTVTAGQIMGWLDGATAIYHCDVRGAVNADNKSVCRSIRLGRKVMGARELQHFACDCAARVLHIYEGAFPQDASVRNCIATAREYTEGRATLENLNTAESAAWSAARKWQQKRLELYLKGGKPWIERPVDSGCTLKP